MDFFLNLAIICTSWILHEVYLFIFFTQRTLFSCHKLLYITYHLKKFFIKYFWRFQDLITNSCATCKASHLAVKEIPNSARMQHFILDFFNFLHLKFLSHVYNASMFHKLANSTALVWMVTICNAYTIIFGWGKNKLP